MSKTYSTGLPMSDTVTDDELAALVAVETYHGAYDALINRLVNTVYKYRDERDDLQRKCSEAFDDAVTAPRMERDPERESEGGILVWTDGHAHAFMPTSLVIAYREVFANMRRVAAADYMQTPHGMAKLQDLIALIPNA
jgi:hypothetical protein